VHAGARSSRASVAHERAAAVADGPGCAHDHAPRRHRPRHRSTGCTRTTGLTFERVSMRFPDGTAKALEEVFLRHQAGRVRDDRRPVGLRQVDAAEDHRRAAEGDDGPGRARRGQTSATSFRNATLLAVGGRSAPTSSCCASSRASPRPRRRRARGGGDRARRPVGASRTSTPSRLSGGHADARPRWPRLADAQAPGLPLRRAVRRAGTRSRAGAPQRRAARPLRARAVSPGLFITHSISEAVYLSTARARSCPGARAGSPATSRSRSPTPRTPELRFDPASSRSCRAPWSAALRGAHAMSPRNARPRG